MEPRDGHEPPKISCPPVAICQGRCAFIWGVCAGGGCCTPGHSKATAHPQGVLTVVENASWSWGGCTPDLQGPFLGGEGLWQAGQGWIRPPPLPGKGQVSLRLN